MDHAITWLKTSFFIFIRVAGTSWGPSTLTLVRILVQGISSSLCYWDLANRVPAVWTLDLALCLEARSPATSPPPVSWASHQLSGFHCGFLPSPQQACSPFTHGWLTLNLPSCTLFLVVQSLSRVSFQSHGLQHDRLLCLPLSPRVHWNSCRLSWWCHPTISSSAAPFSFCPQYFPASGSFPVSWLLASSGQSWNFCISPSSEYSELISFRIDWFDLLAVQGTLKSLLQYHNLKHQFFDPQPSLWSNCLIHTWLLEKL